MTRAPTVVAGTARRGRAQRRGVLLALTLLLPSAGASSAARITAPTERELALTVYGQGVGVVHDRREISLPVQPVTLRWPGVTPSLRRETVRVSGGDRALQGYRVRHRPISMDALLEAYLGKPVGIERATARGPQQADGVLLSAAPTLVAVDGEVHSVDSAALVFPEGVPINLGGVPALDLELAPTDGSSGVAPGKTPLTVGYLTDGLSWSVDYVVTLRAGGDRLDLVARATIANTSGMDVVEADVELVAGDLEVPATAAHARVQEMAAAGPQRAGDVAPRRLGDLQRYALGRPVTLADGERRSVRLFARRAIPVERTYLLTPGPLRPRPEAAGWRAVPLQTRLGWTARQGPLPAGTVRVYSEADDRGRFLGGDRIEDRPQGQAVRIEPGRPFDLTARRRQTRYERLDERVYAVSHEIRLHNGGPSAASVRVEEPLPGDWRITDASRQWHQAAAQLAVWQLEVPAGATRQIAYRARIER